MTDSVVVEGYARLRDGKKVWKTRWLVLRKPSPVADCLLLLVFKDKSDKAQGNKERTSFTLEEICGLEAGQWYEGVAFTLAILCLNQSTLLGFDSREALQAWDVRLRYSLGEVHRFSVAVLPGTKLESGPATLHLCNNLLALVRDVPPLIIGHWNLPDLRRYGPVPNGFVFEGGTRCGYWAGVFLLVSPEGEHISFLFDCIVRGISPTRGPFGLRPVLPDPSASPTHSEEKLNHEAQELEKRLSMLSHRSSTVSSTYCPSAGGDDRSISGSSDTSDTSQSDCSIGSRLAIWSEPASNPPESAGHVAVKAALQSMEKLSVSQGSGSRPTAKPPRQLQEIGRQSSSDSGIATGSHSSYSGSFSSYTGSLDITSREDFGFAFSLPPRLAHDLSPCICPTVSGNEYQVPTSLRYLYDTPRSLLQEGNVGARDNETPIPVKDPSGLITESANEDKSSATSSDGQYETTERQSVSEHLQPPSEESKKTKVAPSSEHPDSCHICSSLTSKTIVTICSVCAGFKGTPYIPASGSAIPKHKIFITADQSVDKSSCRPETGSEYSFALKTFLEKSWAFPVSGSLRSSVKTNEELPLPKKGKEKLASLFADLLGFPSTDGQPEEAKTHSLNWYVSMSAAFGNELKSAPTGTCVLDSQQDKRAAIYENCLKCQSEHCHPPPRVLPAEIYRNRNTSTLQTLPAGLKGSQERKASVDEELLHQAPSDGRQCMDRKCQNEEIDGQTEASEARKCLKVEEKSKYELMGSCSQQKFPQEAEGAVFILPPDVPVPEKPRSEGITYVNIPISPTSKKQLNYMELELQEPGPGTQGTAAQRKSCTKYAQIDITATEMAHKVGTQHALGRQEGLHTLDLRRKGTPH
ncbi:Protein Dok-7 Downstream of tyrosine kinase 7 [Channa argus]|uniref:Protein Dok-7 Downstream of tyrosine kinase 7 n=1 Tax=Channa argus TaxID=215402 RepID=A0A6G1Q5N0_CHAAH|nr:Protein Dok-7 Downstream of tyrosine kinase 7 [Channa argus]